MFLKGSPDEVAIPESISLSKILGVEIAVDVEPTKARI